ncbi:MAG: serine/threonine protein kinase, partial [Candidatus Competibacterales bacterium]
MTLQVGASILGRYGVRSQLGKGGMGSVYWAVDLDTQRDVAVKVLTFDPDTGPVDNELTSRFQREAEILQRLNHPHIVEFIEFNRDEGGMYLVMQLVPGLNLLERIKSAPPLTLREILDIALQMCQALVYAHSFDPPFIHRDIKPQNVLLDTQGGHAYLSDFGLAKVIDPELTQLTQMGRIPMTPSWAAPEQIIGEPLTVQTDIYQVGLLLAYMLTGEALYGTNTHISLINRRKIYDEHYVLDHAKVKRLLPPNQRRSLADDLAFIVQQATKRDAADRYTTVKTLQQDLERAKERLEQQLSPRRRRPSRALALPVGLGIAGICGVVGLWLALGQDGRGPASPQAVAPGVMARGDIVASAASPATPVVSFTPDIATLAVERQTSLTFAVAVEGTAGDALDCQWHYQDRPLLVREMALTYRFRVEGDYQIRVDCAWSAEGGGEVLPIRRSWQVQVNP